MPIKKGEIDYKKYRKVGYKLTKEEVEYIKNDVTIVAMALESMFDNDLTKMTIGSNALKIYKGMTKKFDRFYQG